MRKVWYHQIWIQNYLGFIVSDLINTPLLKWGVHISTVGHGFAIKEVYLGWNQFLKSFSNTWIFNTKMGFFSLYFRQIKDAHVFDEGQCLGGLHHECIGRTNIHVFSVNIFIWDLFSTCQNEHCQSSGKTCTRLQCIKRKKWFRHGFLYTWTKEESKKIPWIRN